MKEERITVDCNNCGANNFKVIFEENKAQLHRIVKCKECGLMYANPQTTHDIDGKASAGNLSVTKVNESKAREQLSNYTPETDQYLYKQFIQKKDYDKVLDFLETRTTGDLLEIGSFAGVFLDSAKRRGWEVTGLEPMLTPALFAEQTFSLNIIKNTLENTEFPPESFDAVTSFHVIEHVYDPKEFLNRINGLLRRTGILVLETPTYDTLTFKLLRHRERSMRCSGHMYFYTQRTLKLLVEQCGFSVIKQEKVGRTLTLDRLFTNIGIITGKKKAFESISKSLGFENMILSLNMRDMQRIYCQKQ